MDRRIQNLLIIVFKTVNNYPPPERPILVKRQHQKPESDKQAASTETYYDSLWQELSKVLGVHYLEQDF